MKTLAEKLRAGMPVANEAASLLEKYEGMLERMDAEMKALRDPAGTIQRALIMAAFMEHNQQKPAGSVFDAAVQLFGREAVEKAVR